MLWVTSMRHAQHLQCKSGTGTGIASTDQIQNSQFAIFLFEFHGSADSWAESPWPRFHRGHGFSEVH